MALLKQSIRFGLVGFALSAAGIFNFWWLLEALNSYFHYMVIYCFSYLLNMTMSYLVYAKLVFNTPKLKYADWIKYGLSTIWNFLVSGALLFWVLETWPMDPVLARIGVAFLLAPVMFILHKVFTFKNAKG